MIYDALLRLGGEFARVYTKNKKRLIDNIRCCTPTYQMPFCVEPSENATIFFFGRQSF